MGSAKTLLISSFVLLFPAITWADTPTDSVELAPVVVQATTTTSLTSPATSAANAALDQVPGGTSLVDESQLRASNTGNLEDSLNFVPGVYAQATDGAEGRLSVRGSGLSIPWAVKGVRLLRDGLPIMEADGWYHSQLVEPLDWQRVEVYRGASALAYGASTLGGAINFVTQTGYTAAPLVARVETSGDDYNHVQLASGQVLGKGWDYYTSLSGYYSDGWRDQSATHATMFYGNLGYRESAVAETRLHLSVDDSNQQLAGALTRSQLEANPTQANPASLFYGDANQFKRYRLDAQHTVLLDSGGRLDAGAFYETQTIFHPLEWNVYDMDKQNYGASLRVENPGQWLGLDSRFAWGGLTMLENASQDAFAPVGDQQKGNFLSRTDSNVLTSELFAEETLALTERFSVIAGSQLAYSNRQQDVTSYAVSVTPYDESRGYVGVSPLLGVLWQVTAETQWFANVSRSVEPPTLYEYYNSSLGLLDAQTALTVETGARRTTGRWQWSAAVYRSEVHDEILTVQDTAAWTGYSTGNVAHTLHEGLELGADGHLPLAWLANGDLHLQCTYTLSHFRFQDDESFGNNALPGIPTQAGRVGVSYEKNGFHVGPTLEVASDYDVDFANTLTAPGYAVWGLAAGYDDERLSLFVRAVNLSNTVYVSSSDVLANAGGSDQAVFHPGQPRGFYAGVEVRW